MGSTTLLRFTSCYCSSSSLPPFASPARAAVRASRGTGHVNSVEVNRQWKRLSSFPENGNNIFPLAQAKGPSPQRQLRVAALFGLFKKKQPPVAVRETVIPDPDYRIPIVLLGDAIAFTVSQSGTLQSPSVQGQASMSGVHQIFTHYFHFELPINEGHSIVWTCKGAAGALTYTDNVIAAAPLGLLGLLLLFQTTRVKFVFDDEALEVKIGDELDESGENVFVGGKNRWKYSTFTNWEFWWPNFPVLVYFKETQTKPEGQIHFFPLIFNGKQVYDVLVERAGPSKTSGPK